MYAIRGYPSKLDGAGLKCAIEQRPASSPRGADASRILLCSPGALRRGFTSPLGDQFFHKAALATNAAELPLYPTQKLAAWLEHYALAIEPGRELVPWLDAQGTGHRGGQDEPPLCSESKQSCHNWRSWHEAGTLTEGASPARARPSGGALVFYDGIFVYRWAGKEGWVYMKGSSILDRRSLLRRRPAPGRSPGLKGNPVDSWNRAT